MPTVGAILFNLREDVRGEVDEEDPQWDIEGCKVCWPMVGASTG